MEQIITVIVSSLCGIITALGGFVIAYLHKKTKQLEDGKKILEARIENMHNGFRQDVFKAVVSLREDVKGLNTDMKLIKQLVVENKTHYKEVEGRK